MAPYVLIATALVLLGIVAWLWEAGVTRGEPARILLVWLALGAVTAIISAAGIWIEDASVSLSFTAAARMYAMIVVFVLFLFTRSFSVPVGFGVFFWSVPLQMSMAVIIMNWEKIFKLSGSDWILDMGSPAAIITVVVTWLYGILALGYAAGLYLTLRREGREKEKGRTLVMMAAIAVMFLASGLRGFVSGAAGTAISAAYIGYLAGVLLLIWAFRGPVMPRSAER